MASPSLAAQFVLNFIEWYYVPMHVGFLLGLVPLSRQFGRGWLTLAFLLELVPMWYLVNAGTPAPWFVPSSYATEFYWFTLVHRIAHTTQAFFVVVDKPPRLDLKPPLPIIEIIAEVYVYFDLANHFFCISARLASISHPLIVAFCAVFWLAAFKYINHEIYLLYGTTETCPCGQGVPATYRAKWSGAIGWSEVAAFPVGQPDLGRYWRGALCGGAVNWFTACEHCVTDAAREEFFEHVRFGWPKPTNRAVVYQLGFAEGKHEKQTKTD